MVVVTTPEQQAALNAAVATAAAAAASPAAPVPAVAPEPGTASASLASSNLAVNESQAAAFKFEQAVLAQGVAISPGILRLRPEDVLAHCAPIGVEINKFALVGWFWIRN